MSFIGKSVFQDAQISGADARLTAAELAIGTKVAQSAYNGKIAEIASKHLALDATDAQHTASIAALDAAKVEVSVYSAKMTALDVKDADHDTRVSVLEAAVPTKVAQTEYDTKLAAVDAKDVEQDGRLTSVEGRTTALESDISSRVQAEIDAKVAQTVFDALVQDFLDTESQLSAALATKVATTVQVQTDAAQDALIASKVAQPVYDSKVSLLENRDYYFERRFLALDEFVRTMLATYTITKPDGTPFVYTATVQNLNVTPSQFTFMNRRANGAVVVKLADYMFHTFLGDMRAITAQGTVVATLNRNSFNSSTLQADITPSVALSDANFPLAVEIRDTRQAIIRGVFLSLAQYQGLPVA
jgi:hypothetical protein